MLILSVSIYVVNLNPSSMRKKCWILSRIYKIASKLPLRKVGELQLVRYYRLTAVNINNYPWISLKNNCRDYKQSMKKSLLYKVLVLQYLNGGKIWLIFLLESSYLIDGIVLHVFVLKSNTQNFSQIYSNMSTFVLSVIKKSVSSYH